jgi:hypothetical protein
MVMRRKAVKQYLRGISLAHIQYTSNGIDDDDQGGRPRILMEQITLFLLTYGVEKEYHEGAGVRPASFSAPIAAAIHRAGESWRTMSSSAIPI